MTEIDIKSTPGERLRQARKRRDWSAEQLAKAVGYTPGTIWHHENGTRNISVRAAREYGRILKVAPELILYGNNFNQAEENTGKLLTRRVALLTVPLLSCSNIEQFRSIAGGSRPMSEQEIFAPIDLPEGHRVFAIRMQDDSMASGEKAIYRGEPVYIDPAAKWQAGDIVAATLDGSAEILIRKYRRTTSDDAFDLVALNPDYGFEEDAHTRNAVIVGRVIGIYRAY